MTHKLSALDSQCFEIRFCNFKFTASCLCKIDLPLLLLYMSNSQILAYGKPQVDLWCFIIRTCFAVKFVHGIGFLAFQTEKMSHGFDFENVGCRFMDLVLRIL